jgi:putative ATP-binding cassette transporter
MTPSTSPSTPQPAPAVSSGSVSGKRRHFLRQVFRLAGPYWKCERRAKIRAATLALFLLTVAQVGLTVWGNYWNRALFDALEQRSVRGLLIQVAVFALIFAISIVVTGAHLLVKRWLQLDWRAWLTDQLMGRWMEDGRHYRLLFTPGEHDNPDQRIAEDIRIATESAIGLGHTLVFSFLILGLFADILWSVSGSMAVPGTTVEVPGYMVPLAFVYAALGSGLGWILGRPLVRSTNALQTAEATFRFGLSRARENTEAIALMRGEPMERSGSTARFGQVVREWHRQSFAYLGLVSFGTAYGALLPVFPILIAAPQYIAGGMTLGVLMQAAQAFQRLTGALSWPVDNIGEIARCRASAERVLSLDEAIRRLDAGNMAPDAARIVVERSNRPMLAIEDLSIADPSGEILLDRFSTEIHRGERVLITGHPVVTGSLFKALGGLWPLGGGRVTLPGDGGLLFVPQHPFLPEETLRAVLCYPCPPQNFADADIRQAIAQAGIAWLLPRLDERDDWEQVLSRRARQRVGFARVLLQRPAWIFMEEATDAFDPKGQRLILEMLRRELPDATLVTITFRSHPDLEALHDRTLVLDRGRKPAPGLGEL